ncbi:MAG TPA: lysine--tRNA ligase, partial [Candidatus Nanoarchaeia archaeon]|nr:lysine--tRNA ligase [Candidatus Nanoarchaeia archaeon]
MQNHNGNDKDFSDIFWADQLAKQIISRKKFHYVDKEIPNFGTYTVKTSASLSGVLHIGRLSDTIRGESVVLALKDAGVKTRFIWVAENMDPLRKVPRGVPSDYDKYIGVPVTDIPDPKGCHSSYAEHHMEQYFKVVDEFVVTEMEKFSMRDEYKKGTFNEYIKKILEKIDDVREIQNRYRTNPLKKNWSPWTPICENCGKIVTPHVLGFENGIVKYVCNDYEFESALAKGCGHKGENDPLKGNGKLLWKSEWAAQWARWQVVSEGAGKEYQVPNSAFWINGEIVEKVLDYPMPEPIFYEHLTIDNQKMSASLGNVVYPKDWVEVAPTEILRLFYNKRLMTTRSFSWKDLPIL